MQSGEKLRVYHWPDAPPLPKPGEPVLIRVDAGSPRPAARRELRRVLAEVLAAWSGLSPEQLPLVESHHGPVWNALLEGHTLGISLSYAGGEGWIGLLRKGAIGIDAMVIREIPEARDVARYYLGPEALEAIRKSSFPARAFATAWTEMEARVKCFKAELVERENVPPEERTKECEVRSLVTAEGVVVSVAMEGKPPANGVFRSLFA
jgi:hypothetical protein